MNDIIKELIENLKTQDNYITSDPIYTVQKLKKIYGLDLDYGEYYDWINNENDFYVADSKLKAELDRAYILNRSSFTYDDEIIIVNGWEKSFFYAEWETIETFLTEKSAKDYIELHKHRYPDSELKMFVASGYRNPEMRAIREYFLNL